MQQIELYYKKIDRMLSARQPKPKGKGLLSSSNVSAKTDKTNPSTQQMQVVADIVAGIREARKEMMNGK